MGQPNSDELVGKLMAEVQRLRAENARLEEWRRKTDERIERLTFRMWEESSRSSQVDVETLMTLNKQARVSRAPASVWTWKMTAAVVGLLTALAGAARAAWEFLRAR